MLGVQACLSDVLLHRMLQCLAWCELLEHPHLHAQGVLICQAGHLFKLHCHGTAWPWLGIQRQHAAEQRVRRWPPAWCTPMHAHVVAHDLVEQRGPGRTCIDLQQQQSAVR